MKRKIIIYFIIFGLLFGLLNEINPTGGEIPYSMMLNFPTLYTQGVVNKIFNSLEATRFEELQEKTGTKNIDPSLSKDQFEKLSPKDQEEFVFKMTSQKNTVKKDPIIGESGILYMFRKLLPFPILSAVTWGIIGLIVYFLLRLERKMILK